uniref:Ig-like domain-containing protein n=1 Tax=Coturnix japonica TaxID=93934 RepID=A0A8C2Y7X1_COTJA
IDMQVLAVLAAFSLLLIDGHAQVLLQQRPPSVIKKESTTVSIQCKVEGIDDFQAAYIHWYRQLPAGAPERLLYVTGVSQVYYDSDSNKNKYLSSKVGNKICTISVLNVRDDDEGTYYCAYWVSHRGNRLQAALTESRLQLQQHTFIQGPKITAAFLPTSLKSGTAAT